MIPTLEDILDGVLDGTYTRDQAIRWIEKRDTLEDMRLHFTGLAMQAILTRGQLSLPGDVARHAALMADAVVKELSK